MTAWQTSASHLSAFQNHCCHTHLFARLCDHMYSTSLPMASDVSWLWCSKSHTKLVALTRAESGRAEMALFWRYRYFMREGMDGIAVRPRASQYIATGNVGGQSHSSGQAPPAVSACREPTYCACLWRWNTQPRRSHPWERQSGSRADRRITVSRRIFTKHKNLHSSLTQK